MKFSYKNIIYIIAVLGFASVFLSSGRKDGWQMQDNISRYSAEWNAYIAKNDLASLVESTVATYRQAEQDGNISLVTYSGVHASQAFLFMGKLDSAIHYLDIIDTTIVESFDFLNIIYNNISGIYTMKMEMDYSGAFAHFSKALELSRKTGDAKNQLAQLCNIATLYYEYGDSTGLKYAREACGLTAQIKNPYLEACTYITMGQMLLASERPDEAWEYNAKALDIIEKEGLPSLLPIINQVSANICFKQNDLSRAEEYFIAAYSCISVAYPDSKIEILLDYGNFLKYSGELKNALQMFEEALSISYKTQNNMYRIEILTTLSDVLYAMNRSDEAVQRFNELRAFEDSILIKQKERLFQKEELLMERQAHLERLRQNEMTMGKMRNTIGVLIVLVLLVLVLVFVIFRMFRHKFAHYRKIKGSLLTTIGADKTSDITGGRDVEKEDDNPETGKDRLYVLYQSMEKLMTEDKLYHDNAISLESMAGTLNTNKSYISKAINCYAGTSFHNYINGYRIKEAVAVLSDAKSEIPMKELAISLGFNSLSTFYRVFQKEAGCSPLAFRENVTKIINDDLSGE